MYVEDSAEATPDRPTCVWNTNSLGTEGSPIWDRCVLTPDRSWYSSCLPLTDPRDQWAEFVCLCISCHINSAPLNLWPTDGFSVGTVLFCLHFLSLLIDFTLLLSSWGSCVSQSKCTLVCVHFWDHSSDVLSTLFSPFRCSCLTLYMNPQRTFTPLWFTPNHTPPKYHSNSIYHFPLKQIKSNDNLLGLQK